MRATEETIYDEPTVVNATKAAKDNKKNQKRPWWLDVYTLGGLL